MKNDIIEYTDISATVLRAAESTKSGQEIVVQWTEQQREVVSYQASYDAKQSLVDSGIARWVEIPNGYGGWDYALYKN